MQRRQAKALRRSVMIGLVGALILTGCASDEPEAPAADDETEAEPAGEASDDGTAAEGDGLVIDGEEIADAELWAAAQEEGGLSFYTAMLEETELALLELFEEDTGLEVDFFRVATNSLQERILTEHGAGQLAADVIRMPDVTFISELVELGIFEEYETAVIDSIPDEYVHEGGLYYTTAIGPTCLAINTEFLPTDEPPTTYEDLLDPELSGEVGLAHIGVGTTAWIFGSYTRETYGIEYWESLKEQEPVLTEGNAQVADLLARGEISVAYLRPNVVLERKAEGAPVEIVWAEDAMPIFSFYMGLASGGENPNAAKVFLNWHLSKRGQTATADISGEYSPREDVPPPTMQGVTFPPLSEQPVFQADPEIWANEREAWTDDYWEIFDQPAA